MKILILSCHSDNNRQLAGVTAANKWRYSARHGYDLLTIRMSWERAQNEGFQVLRQFLPIYDAVMVIGSDVVFTNFNVKIESLIQPGDGLIIAREHLQTVAGNPFPFNNDVAIWCQSPKSTSLIAEIISQRDQWMKMKWLWQEWLWKNWGDEDSDEEGWHNYVRLVPARAMNSCHQEGEGKWQPGDYVFHAMSMDEPSKIRLCEYYLQAVKE